MANYANLKAAISAAIKTNGNQEITGQVLQDVLNSMVSVIGANYTFAGVATPATNPGTPDQNVMYLAMEGGTYTNFNGTVLPAGISLLMWNGTWTSETVMYGDGGVFDISVYKSTGGTLATFADLADALDGGNNIPASARKGGMSVKFVQSSDNKYVQYRCMLDEFTTDITKWQGVDAVPTPYSKNLVESGGVSEYYGQYSDDDFIKLLLDSKDKIIAAIKNNGDFVLNTYLESAGGRNIDDEDFIKLTLDYFGKILFGIKQNGNVTFCSKEYICDNDNIWKWAVVDEAGKILIGIKQNGEFFSLQNLSYYGKLMTTIGDSTTSMQSWQPTVKSILGCDYDISAIAGGTLCNVYYSTVTAVSLDSDIVTVQYGTNDWANGNLSLGNITDMADPDSGITPSYCGALNYVCKWLSENILKPNPNKKILMWTPLQRYDGIALGRMVEYGRNSDGDIINHEGKSIKDFCNAIKKIAAFWGFPVLDTNSILQINEITIGKWNENYVPTRTSQYSDWNQINPVDGKVNFVGNMLYDGLHPSANTGVLLGKSIANKLLNI